MEVFYKGYTGGIFDLEYEMTYTYDAKYQLMKEERKNWNSGTSAYDIFEYSHTFGDGSSTYDKLGNRPKDIFSHQDGVGDPTVVTTNYTYKQFSQIDYTDDGTSRWDYYYDTNGNMIKKELFGSDPVHKTDLDYDFLNMMKDFDNSLDETRRGQYNNDDTGLARLQKTVDPNGTPKTRKYVFDGADVVGYYATNGTADKTFVTPFLDENLLMEVDGDSGLYFYFHDALGSVVNIARFVDNSGWEWDTAKTNRYVYYAFGCKRGGKYDTDDDMDLSDEAHKKWDSLEPVEVSETWEPVNQDFEYTGRKFDDESGLTEYRRRTYDVQNCRFIGLDPSGLNGGINRYLYVMNNPIRYIDPFGEKIWIIYSSDALSSKEKIKDIRDYWKRWNKRITEGSEEEEGAGLRIYPKLSDAKLAKELTVEDPLYLKKQTPQRSKSAVQQDIENYLNKIKKEDKPNHLVFYVHGYGGGNVRWDRSTQSITSFDPSKGILLESQKFTWSDIEAIMKKYKTADTGICSVLFTSCWTQESDAKRIHVAMGGTQAAGSDPKIYYTSHVCRRNWGQIGIVGNYERIKDEELSEDQPTLVQRGGKLRRAVYYRLPKKPVYDPTKLTAWRALSKQGSSSQWSTGGYDVYPK